MSETADSLRRKARSHRRMGDEIAGYPEFEGRDEKARQHRSEAAELYRQAREHERREGSRRDRATGPALSVVDDHDDASRSSTERFDARRALRRAGLRGVSAGDRAARKARASSTRAVKSAVASSDAGSLFLYVVASLFGLLVLDALISGRGPGGVSTAFGWLGSAISKLTSPTDPIIKQGTVPGVQPTVNTTTPKATTPSTSSTSAIAAHSLTPR